ncbi:MAG: AraC family transcriptional regulator [Eubacteriales bacterium]|nr:AraC family transcriptional regulator [Eubacteriales bacterium]
MNEFEIISHRQMDGISIFFDTVDYRTAHVHPEWELIWILEECLIITCGQKRFAAQPGDLVLFSPNEPHEFHRMQKSCTFLCLQISPRILPDMGQLSVDGLHPHEYLTNEELQELKAAISSAAAAYLSQENNYALYCLGQCSLVLHKLLSGLPCRMLSQEEMVSIDRRNARLMRLFQFVDDNYMHKIRLQDFAAQEGCSVSYLSHFVKDSINQTFQDYVNSVRFNCACKLIAAGGMRMLDVCLESGFSDYRYFSKSFRQQFGMTPEEYSKHAAAHISQKNAVRSSLHSIERFYSRDESVALLNKFTK